jgi:hypothetical protein
MEWLVGSMKDQIKHLASNQNESLIERKSIAMPGVDHVAKHFAEEVGTRDRYGGRSKDDARDDELKLIAALAKEDIFTNKDRGANTIPDISYSVVEKFDIGELVRMFRKKRDDFIKLGKSF